MAKQKLIDPVDEEQKTQEAEDFVDKMERMADPDGVLTEEEIGVMPTSVTRTPHPFDGFPMGRKIKLVTKEGDPIMVGNRPVVVSSTFIVLLRMEDSVFQDRSNLGVTVETFEKDPKTGEDIRKKDGKRLGDPIIVSSKVMNLTTYHNRVTVHPVTQKHMDTVFDRYVMVGERPRICAVEPSHTARAQIFLKLNKDGRPEVDPRYQLADKRQSRRLRAVFDQVNYQNMKAERLAKEFDSEPSDQDRGRDVNYG